MMEPNIVTVHLYGFANGLYIASAIILLFFSLHHAVNKNIKAAFSVFLIFIAFSSIILFNLYIQKSFGFSSAQSIPEWVRSVGGYVGVSSMIILLHIQIKIFANHSMHAYTLVKKLEPLIRFIYLILVLMQVVSMVFHYHRYTIWNIIILHTAALVAITFTLILLHKGRQAMRYSKELSLMFSIIFLGSIFSIYMFSSNNVVYSDRIQLTSLFNHAIISIAYSFVLMRYSQEEAEKMTQLGDIEHFQITMDLQQAIINNNLFLLYQPKLDLQKNRVVSLEALIRWNHPSKGLIPPSDFIPIIEKSGMIDDLSIWVIEAAIKQAAILQEKQLILPIAINFSTENLKPDLIDFLDEMLRKYDVKPESIHIEITETVFLEIDFQKQKAIDLLKALGVKLSMDDYGTGYSSLAYLQQLSLYELKIDAIFITSLTESTKQQIIVDSIIQMSHAMNMKVTAEGVETREIQNLLQKMGCDIIQGYYLTKPIPMPTLLDWVEDSEYHIEHT